MKIFTKKLEWLNGTLFLKHPIFKIRCYNLIFIKNKVPFSHSPKKYSFRTLSNWTSSTKLIAEVD